VDARHARLSSPTNGRKPCGPSQRIAGLRMPAPRPRQTSNSRSVTWPNRSPRSNSTRQRCAHTPVAPGAAGSGPEQLMSTRPTRTRLNPGPQRSEVCSRSRSQRRRAGAQQPRLRSDGEHPTCSRPRERTGDQPTPSLAEPCPLGGYGSAQSRGWQKSASQATLAAWIAHPKIDSLVTAQSSAAFPPPYDRDLSRVLRGLRRAKSANHALTAASLCAGKTLLDQHLGPGGHCRCTTHHDCTNLLGFLSQRNVGEALASVPEQWIVITAPPH
jgi:hypothetical protein